VNASSVTIATAASVYHSPLRNNIERIHQCYHTVTTRDATEAIGMTVFKAQGIIDDHCAKGQALRETLTPTQYRMRGGYFVEP
jgi:hypothetical protein